jgi:hypothetical protein
MGDLNIGLDDRAIAHNQGAVRQDLSFEPAIDPNGPGERQLSIELGVLS